MTDQAMQDAVADAVRRIVAIDEATAMMAFMLTDEDRRDAIEWIQPYSTDLMRYPSRSIACRWTP